MPLAWATAALSLLLPSQKGRSGVPAGSQDLRGGGEWTSRAKAMLDDRGALNENSTSVPPALQSLHTLPWRLWPAQAPAAPTRPGCIFHLLRLCRGSYTSPVLGPWLLSLPSLPPAFFPPVVSTGTPASLPESSWGWYHLPQAALAYNHLWSWDSRRGCCLEFGTGGKRSCLCSPWVNPAGAGGIAETPVGPPGPQEQVQSVALHLQGPARAVRRGRVDPTFDKGRRVLSVSSPAC